MDGQYPCGHPHIEWPSGELTCATPRCSSQPTACVVHIGLGLGDRLCVCLDGSCSDHASQVRAFAEHDRAVGHDELWDFPASIDAVLDWYHGASGFCDLDYIFVTTPSTD